MKWARGCLLISCVSHHGEHSGLGVSYLPLDSAQIQPSGFDSRALRVASPLPGRLEQRESSG